MNLDHYLTQRLTAMYDDPLTSREQAEARRDGTARPLGGGSSIRRKTPKAT